MVMESKVKIWGEEISSCSECEYLHRDGCDELTCAKDYNIYDYLSEKTFYEIVCEKCPFLQPITKEVIESYGFIKTMEWLVNSNIYRKHPFYISVVNNKITISTIEGFENVTAKTLFEETITNPIEFEFILKSVGVIE